MKKQLLVSLLSINLIMLAFPALAAEPTNVTAVDLGLSIRWATMNVGATTVSGYGDYFAWGETSGYNAGKTTFDWSTYTYGSSISTLKKYNYSASYGQVDNKRVLEAADDAATANWGGPWRMPTEAEWTELRTQCTWTWGTQNGINGYTVTGTNGNCIFLPAAGEFYSTSFYDRGTHGIYWTSSLYDTYPYEAAIGAFRNGYISRGYGGRSRGHTVRAVCPTTTYRVTFNANGGSVSTSSKNVTYAAAYGALPTPTRTGYTFAGWYTSATGGSRVTASTIVKIHAAQTLYAHWTTCTIATGTCGANVTWSLLCDSTLVIRGSGAMTNYNAEESPLYPYRTTIKALEIGEGITSIGRYLLYGCSALEGSLNLPSSLTTIGIGSFMRCSGLTGNLQLSSAITTIGASAFRGCTGLTGDLYLPNSVTALGSNAFYDCSGFDGVLHISEGITALNTNVFRGCSGLTGNLTIPNGVTSIGGSAFYNCSGFNGSLTIPSSVTSIRDEAFKGCSGFTGNLIIPNSVTSIGNGAFYGCSGFTGSLTIPNSVTSIGIGAFNGCSGLTGNLTIPNSVTLIGAYAFADCSGFTGNLTIPNSVTSIEGCCFANCTGLTGPLTIPNSVTSIGYSAFYGCSGFNGSLTIPSSVTSIGNGAFYGCMNLSAIYMEADSAPSIQSTTFENVPKYIPVHVPCGSVENYQTAQYWSEFTEITDLQYNVNVKSIYYNGTELAGFSPLMGYASYTANCATSSILLTATPAYDFIRFTSWSDGNTDNPRSLVLTQDTSLRASFEYTECIQCHYACGDSVVGVLYCDSTLVISGKGATKNFDIFAMNNPWYSNRDRITCLVIKDGVTAIGHYAFYGCRNISAIYMEADSAPSIQSGTFHNVPKSIPVHVPCGAVENYQTAQYWSEFTNIQEYPECECLFASGTCGTNLTWKLYCDSTLVISGTGAMTDYAYNNPAPWKQYGDTLKHLVIEEGVTSIGESAFSGCYSFTGNLTLPSSVTNIGYSAFCGCSGFTGDLTIPNSVTSIGGEAFQGCSGLTGSLIIPNSVTSIGGRAFKNCTGFTGSLTISSSVTSIGELAFAYCTGLTGSLHIPSSVTSIGFAAFGGCSHIVSFDVESSNLFYSSDQGALYNKDKTTFVAFPAGSASISYSILNSVERIYDGAFFKCTGLTGSLHIPNSVTNIGQYAFDYCNNLSAIHIEASSAPTITVFTFNQLPQSVPVYIPCGSLDSYLHTPYWADYTHLVDSCMECQLACGISKGNATWTLRCDSTFVIGGTGVFGGYDNRVHQYFDYNQDCGASDVFGVFVTSPWDQYNGDIRSIIIEEGVTAINTDLGNRNVSSIYVESDVAPTIQSNTFNNVPKSIPVYVPCGAVENYQTAQYWSSFTNITDQLYSVRALPFSAEQGSATAEYNCADTTAMLSATAAAGYRFTEWQDGNTQNPRLVKLTQDTVIVALFEMVSGNATPGALSGTFSINDSTTVHFAQGNLQFNAAQGYHFTADGIKPGIWRFAEHQYDYVGNTSSGNVYENGEKCTNTLVCSTYDGWIDLFGWGSSGWNSGANAYEPYSYTDAYADYYPGGSSANSLTGDYAKADWGVYNAISNGGNEPGLWRTLSKDEWDYMLRSRENASALVTYARIESVLGFVFLPDNWDWTNAHGLGRVTQPTQVGNVLTAEQWQDIEEAGALFLPITGARGTNRSVSVSGGFYWATDAYNTTAAYHWLFSSVSATRGNSYYDRSRGQGVRLVCEAGQAVVTIGSSDNGTVTGGGTYPEGSTVTLTAVPDECYHFVSWQDGNTANPRTITATADASYTATFAKTAYLIRFLGDDDAELYRDSVDCGDVPTYDGQMPTKTATDQYTYTFAGWEPTLAAASADASYKATFASEVNNYTVNGEEVPYGTQITLTAPDSACYTFQKWSDGATVNPYVLTLTQDTAISPIYTINTFSLAASSADEAKGRVELISQHTIPNGAEAVDLGLSVKWANMNIGSEAPEEYGDYFSWGETVGYMGGKTTFYTYIWSGSSKYTTNGNTTLELEDDAAYANWGDKWRIPTNEEWKELRTQCTWTNATVNGIACRKVTAPNGNCIYLPLAGYREGSLFNCGSSGLYWSSTLKETSFAYITNMAGYSNSQSIYRCWMGLSVRPVTASADPFALGCGDSARVAAIPAENYHFVSWSDGATDSIRTIIVESDTSVVAYFEINQFVVNGDTLPYGSEITLTAPAVDCQHFVQWSDGVTANPRTITVTGNVSVTPQYAVNRYLIRFVDDLGTVLQSDSVDCGEAPAYLGATPTKASTAEHTYTFVGWSPAIAAASEDATYTAQFTSETNLYTITFRNYDGTVLQSAPAVFGTMPQYTAATPQKPATDQYTYTFKGWNPALVNVSAAATYVAQFDSVVNTYIVNGEEVPYGSTVTLTAPAVDCQHFVQWSDGATANPRTITVTGNITVTPQYAVNRYLIRFVNEDNSELYRDSVDCGDIPVYNGQMPTKATTAQYTYTFAGWTPAIAAASADATYKATFGTATNSYTVTFRNYNGVALQSSQVAYGVVPQYTGSTPTKPATAQYTYAFKGWDRAIASVTGSATYTAQFDSVVNQYAVTFKNYDGTLLQESQFAYGTTPQYNGATPQKPATAEFTYTFSGWNPAITSVVGAATYIAQFSQETNTYIVNGEEVPYGTQITLTAPDSACYDFTAWSDGNTQNPRTITVTGNLTLTPQYSVRHYTITATGINGTVIGGGTYDCGNTVILAPVPNEHYHFVGWQDGVADSLRTVEVTGNASYTALFEIDQFIVNGEELPYGSTITLRPEDRDCQHFTQWSDGNTQNPRTITVTGPINVYPQYAVNRYLIRFVDDLGTVLQADSVDCGEAPAYLGATPTKASTAEHTYTFVGWSPAIEAASANATYTAQFTSETNLYTITFRNYDGTVLQSAPAVFGTMPQYTAATPQKPATDQYTYTFKGWNPALVNVSAAATYVAQFDSVVNTYIVNGEEVPYGSTVTLTAPAVDCQHFVQWSDGNTQNPRTITVTGNITVTPQYAVNRYLIRFVNEDNSELYRDSVDCGDIPTYNGQMPTKATTAQYTYTFAGWTPAIAAASADATYKATFGTATNSYTVTFQNYNGITLQSSAFAYGALPQYNGTTPSKPATAQYTYTFRGWDRAIASVTGSATYTAQFDSVVNQYTVTFQNYDGTALQLSTIAYGQTPVYTGATPTKPSTAEFTYTFSGWNPTITSVTGPATYIAQFSQETNTYIVNGEEVPYGTQITLTAPDSACYDFTAWSDGNTQNPRTITVTGNITLTPQYTVRHYTITATGINGTVIGGGTYDCGNTVILAPVPDEHYHFVGWQDGVADSLRTVEVTGNASYTALFEIDQFIVNGEEMPYGSTITLRPEERDCQHFTQWSDGNTDNPRTITVTGTINVYPQYAVNRYLIRFLDEDGSVLQADSVDCGSTPVYNGAMPTKPATAEFSYTFAGWTPTVVEATADADYSATYTSTVNQYTIITQGEHGTTTGDGTYDYGTIITLTAAADAGYHFAGWTDDPSAEASRSETVVADSTFIALFEPDCGPWAEWPLIEKYGWLLMLDHQAVRAEGYSFTEQQVSWYRVVGEPDDDLTQGDDQQVGTGYYLTLGQPLTGTGDYYAVVDVSASQGTLCQGLMRSRIAQYAGGSARQIVLIPTAATAGEQVRVEGLDPQEETVIMVYSSAGQLIDRITTTDAATISMQAPLSAGCYQVRVHSESVDQTLRYIVNIK